MVAVSGERCPCGRPFRLLAAIEGRNDDILYLPAAAGGTAAVHPLALRSALAGISPGWPSTRWSTTPTACTSGPPRAPTPTVSRRSGWCKSAWPAGWPPQGVARPAVQVELRDNLQDERDTAGKFKLVESRLRRPTAPVP
jgi:phenylacetate-CoA ligase